MVRLIPFGKGLGQMPRLRPYRQLWAELLPESPDWVAIRRGPAGFPFRQGIRINAPADIRVEPAALNQDFTPKPIHPRLALEPCLIWVKWPS